MYDMKALYQATSVADAVALRLAHPEAQIIAGGSDVLVQMREGKRAGAELISIYGLDELRGVSLEADGTLRIGSLTSFSHITQDPLIQNTSTSWGMLWTRWAARKSAISAPSAATPATASRRRTRPLRCWPITPW